MHSGHWFLLTALAAVLAGTTAALPVAAGIDATRTAQPIAKLVFGGFMEPATTRVAGTTCWRDLYNNVYGKGDIANYRQSVFRGRDDAGWEWDWPESGGPSLKNYPEVILGRSPWSEAKGGDQLPRRLSETRLTLDFDFSTVGSGLWLESFDFWITRSDHPSTKEIVSNLTIWTMNHGLKPTYKGRRTTLRIGGRTYEAIFETPTEQPEKPWKTLCLVDTEPRSKGSLELSPLVDALIAHGLAQPTDFLATAELGSEVAYGKGRTTLRVFRLR